MRPELARSCSKLLRDSSEYLRIRNISLLVFCLVVLSSVPDAAEENASTGNDNSAAVQTQLSGAKLQDAMLANTALAKSIAFANGVEWCQTQLVYDQRYAQLNDGALVCPPMGDCDLPGIRNENIPATDDPPMIIRLKINVFQNDDGSNPAATQADVDAQIEQLNSDYFPSRIQFEYETEFINSTAFRQFSIIEEGAMKGAFADKPDSQLNVYVVNILDGFLGVGTFPWDSRALLAGGGTIVDDNWFGAGQKTLTHEVGHCLGLWHTHHGVSEVSTCGVCYERADGAEGDETGDYCADTDPTPTNFGCGPPGGTDQCSGVEWGATDPQNYMGYAPDACWIEFSPQQWGRMQCWTDAVLANWQRGVSFTADTTFGPAPLLVEFQPTTSKTVITWNWDFGDGAFANVEAPVHNYVEPGSRDVFVSIDATDGNYEALRRDFIAVYADTIIPLDSEAAPASDARLDVSAVNYLALSQINIPIQWSGDMGLVLDSVTTAGLRTDVMDTKGFTSIDPFNKRAVYTMTANIAAGAPPLAPGSGPIASLYFSIPSEPAGDSNLIQLSYGATMPTFVYGGRVYSPVFKSGLLSLCAKAGDPNASGNINIADVTYLIAYIFSGGPPPLPALSSGDANCSGSVNIADITFLIARIFAGGPPPCDCAP